MEFKEFLLNEMRVHHMGDAEEDQIIAFRGHIWLFNSKISEEDVGEIYDTITREHPTPKVFDNPPNDYYSLFDYIREYVADCILGRWNPEEKYISISREEANNPSTSKLIKKVAETLKVKKVYVQDEFEFKNDQTTYPRKKLLGKLPKIMYHGTASGHGADNLLNILKKGIWADEGTPNWRVTEELRDRVFLSANPGYCQQYAWLSVNKRGGRPIIFGVEVPDPNLIDADWDMDRMSHTNTYQHKDQPQPRSSISGIKTSLMAGIVSYKGRIPAAFIKEVWLWVYKKNSENMTQHYRGPLLGEWRKFSPKTLYRKVWEMGSEWVYYYACADNPHET